MLLPFFCFFFFFNDTATTEIYTLSLHDALPILCDLRRARYRPRLSGGAPLRGDRKSTRLNSSHTVISYAVFCLKKKKKKKNRGKKNKTTNKHTTLRTKNTSHLLIVLFFHLLRIF